MPKAYRYHRFSTPDQDKGTSIERQRKATLALCKRKEWELQKQIDDIAALHITYGAGALSASTALAKKNQVAIRTLETRV